MRWYSLQFAGAIASADAVPVTSLSADPTKAFPEPEALEVDARTREIQ